MTQSSDLRAHRSFGGRVHRWISMLAAVATGAAVLAGTVVAPATPAEADPDVPVAQILMSKQVYRPFEPIVADGVVGYFNQCDAGGKNDFVYPWADVYVVKGNPTVGVSLSDVNGAPNAIVGFGGGGFIQESLGWAGVGGLKYGTYSVVVDECQDGKFDFRDAYFPNAFRVVVPADVPPIDGSGIFATKQAAKDRATAYRNAGIAWTVIQKVASKGKHDKISSKMFDVATLGLSGLGWSGLADPRKVVAGQLENMKRHYEGIAADPPNPDFDDPTVVGPMQHPEVAAPGPVFELGSGVSSSTAVEEALSAALLDSLEKYQGAAAAKDGPQALRLAREAQMYARLLAQVVRDGVSALEVAADEVEAATEIDDALAELDAGLDELWSSGLTAGDRNALARMGIDIDEFTQWANELYDPAIETTTVASVAADLRAVASGSAGTADALDQLADSLQGNIDALVANPDAPELFPVASAGGPYAATYGESIELDASASAPGESEAELVSFEWDLDGDGEFDDATGPTPVAESTGPALGVVGVLVTDGDGRQSVAYAARTLTGSPAPTLTTFTPDDAYLEVADDSVTELSVDGTAAADAVWRLDGDEVGTGPSFELDASETGLGAHVVRVVAGGTVRDWYVTVVAPDADEDGFPAAIPIGPADCDDDDPTVFPGAPELADGKDNDCDPATPDGGVAPTVDGLTADPTIEGETVTATATIGTAGATGPFTVSVDWGDGTATPGTLTSSTLSGTHAYADDGTYVVRMCATSSTGLEGCRATTVDVANAEPTGRLFDLSGWTAEGVDSGQGLAEWVLADDALSVEQLRNSDPSWFIADNPVVGSEVNVTMMVRPTGDNDFIGFSVGIEPGTINDPDGRFLLVDWKQGNQASSCPATAGQIAERGLAVSLVTGINTTKGEVDDRELWNHAECDGDPAGTVAELARGTNFGDTGYVKGTEYHFRFLYAPDRIQIYVNDELEFDIANDVIGGEDFPYGGLAFYNYSQNNVIYSGYSVEAIGAVEGEPVEVPAKFEDPGTADTHTALVDFGDGSPLVEAEIDESGGKGTASAVHTYEQEGEYPATFCLSDDDGGTTCLNVVVRVANAPPEVDAGDDRETGPAATVDGVTFEDPGVRDTHTVTVDWGDGSEVDDAAHTFHLGDGVLTGTSHTYSEPGTYEVAVCVSDDAGASDCDTLELTVPEEGPPTLDVDGPTEVVEGSLIERGLGYTDPSRAGGVSATVDWGDGTSVPAVLQQGDGIGSGVAAHTYRDDGVYPVIHTFCTASATCIDDTVDVTVTNADPVVTAGAGAGRGSIEASFTDAGPDDIHTAVVDWGDGSAPEAVPVAQEEGGGQLAADHTYATPTEHEVEVCVTDDDGGVGCATVMVAAGDPPGPPIEVSAIGGDGNARVRWEPPLDDGGFPILSYEVESSPAAPVVTVPADELVAIVDGLDNDRDYTFRVRASNAIGWGPWSEPSNLTRTRSSCPGAIFDDVGPEHAFCPEIKWMADNGVSVGFPGNVYRPAQVLNRQQMAAFSYRLLNPGQVPVPCSSRPFTDVPVTNPFCGEIAWMKAAGISAGRPDGSFGPGEAVTRQAMAAFLFRLTDPGGPEPPACVTDEFPDVPAASLFCGHIDWLVDNGVAGGTQAGLFAPAQSVLREQMAAFIFRYNILTGHIS